MDVVCGVDAGTGGVRAYAVDPQGQVVAKADCVFDAPAYQPGPGLFEQEADAWWRAVQVCLRDLTGKLNGAKIVALSVDSTSGTFVPVDAQGEALMPALMYNDGRAKGLEVEVNAAAGEFCARSGYTFPPAFALVKMLWLARHRPEILARTYKLLHAADFVVGRLTGDYNCSDTSNALKSGVDLLTGEWPDFIESELGLPLEKFPRVFRPGDKVGEVSADAAALTGLDAGTAVIAGVTDGTASFLASGAKAVGDWNLTIGTTIVTRGISRVLVRDPQGRIYCHRHPDGYWLPGGASNVGGEALAKTFGERIRELDEIAASTIPTSLLVYPLVKKGERMPFVSDKAEGFVVGEPRDEFERFAGYLEGIALVAAWSIEAAGEVGAPADGEFFMAGGGAHGKNLGRVLASVLEKPLIVSHEPEGAMGGAILSAAWAWYSGSVSAAQAAMVQRAEILEPVPAWIEPLKQKLEELKAECRSRGFI